MAQRLFVALYPPPEACDDLARALAGQPPGLRFAAPDRWHVTLAFCPAVDDRRRDRLVAELRDVAAAHEPLTLRIAGAGAFPKPTRATALWAGVRCGDGGRSDLLAELAAGVRGACERAGAGPERRRFIAHLTLARLRHPRDLSPRIWVLDRYGGPEWTAAELVLVASRLGAGPRGGAQHDPIVALGLGRGH